MPGVIVLPEPGKHFGPGGEWQLTDTDLGPFPIDDEVTIRVSTVGGGTEVDDAIAYLNRQLNTWGWYWLNPKVDIIWQSGVRDNLREGSQANLIATRKHANGTVVWQTSTPIVYSPTQFLWKYGFDALSRSQASGGLTPDQDEKLQLILDAVYFRWPDA